MVIVGLVALSLVGQASPVERQADFLLWETTLLALKAFSRLSEVHWCCGGYLLIQGQLSSWKVMWRRPLQGNL